MKTTYRAAVHDAIADAMRAGHNQYPPMAGVPALRRAISDKVARLYGRRNDAEPIRLKICAIIVFGKNNPSPPLAV